MKTKTIKPKELQAKREQSGLTRREVAEMLGVTQEAIYQTENRAAMSPERAEKITAAMERAFFAHVAKGMKVLGVTPAQVLKGIQA